MLPHSENPYAYLAAVAVASMLSGGCVLFQPYVGDLKFKTLARSSERTMANPAPNTPTLRLTFTTERDLLELGRPGGARANVGLCPTADRNQLHALGPYFQGRSFWDFHSDIELGEGLHEFEILFTYDPFLLHDGPDRDAQPVGDLCFKVHGFSYWGAGGFDSRPAVVPKAAIEAAIQSQPPVR